MPLMMQAIKICAYFDQIFHVFFLRFRGWSLFKCETSPIAVLFSCLKSLLMHRDLYSSSTFHLPWVRTKAAVIITTNSRATHLLTIRSQHSTTSRATKKHMWCDEANYNVWIFLASSVVYLQQQKTQYFDRHATLTFPLFLARAFVCLSFRFRLDRSDSGAVTSQCTVSYRTRFFVCIIFKTIL